MHMCMQLCFSPFLCPCSWREQAMLEPKSWQAWHGHCSLNLIQFSLSLSVPIRTSVRFDCSISFSDRGRSLLYLHYQCSISRIQYKDMFRHVMGDQRVISAFHTWSLALAKLQALMSNDVLSLAWSLGPPFKVERTHITTGDLNLARTNRLRRHGFVG